MQKFQKLSRAEMKNVLGGQPGGPGGCTLNKSCTAVFFDGHNTVTGPGKCDVSCNCIPDSGGGSNYGFCTNTDL
ncbi:bacteriocin-like protein [Mucilaginibacter ginsenosidivorans]|uniref:bacteriocin-like protein n=1 Tax=Mucilaginibacter ginsenosidivorans TaxID=398053 RepID=UPI00406BB483